MNFFKRAANDADAPPAMTAQDLDDWLPAVDAKAQADRTRGVTRDSVINAGQAAADVINARRGKS